MLIIFNIYNTQIGVLYDYSNLCIERKLYMDERILSFDTIYTNSTARAIKPEGYIQYESTLYVVKEINIDSTGKMSVIAQMDLNDFEDKVWKVFFFKNKSFYDALSLAIQGLGWTIMLPVSSSEYRSLRLEYTNTYEILKELGALYHVNFTFNNVLKRIFTSGTIGSDKGKYLSSELNLKQLSVQKTSYDLFTELEAYGKDGLTFESINDGKKYVTNYSYYPAMGLQKKKRYIWNAPDYENAADLLADAKIKLSEMARPYISYQIDAVDLASINSDYSFNTMNLGETITIIDEYTNTFDKQILIEKKEYPDDPEKNTYTFANKTMTITDLMGQSSGLVSNVRIKKASEVSSTLFDSGGSSDEVIFVDGPNS